MTGEADMSLERIESKLDALDQKFDTELKEIRGNFGTLDKIMAVLQTNHDVTDGRLREIELHGNQRDERIRSLENSRAWWAGAMLAAWFAIQWLMDHLLPGKP